MAALALLAVAPGAAAREGELATLPIGRYVCELPGDAAGPVGRRVAEEGFEVVNSSSYKAQGTIGSYLMTGDMLTMTSGAFNGKRYRRASTGMLRKLGSDGAETELRCVRRTRNNRTD